MLAGPIHDCPLRPLQPLPRISQASVGTGGRIRVAVEDFEVEEIPLYLPNGEGEHLYLWIEKVDIAAETLRRTVARALQVGPGEVGMAGMKDRRAVTRQWVSVPRRAESLVAAIEGPRIRVLQAKPHRNKLRTGHLAGNRFRILLRGCEPGALAAAQAKVASLTETGLPNFYGSQRMGHGGATLAAGWALGMALHGFAQVRLADDTLHAVNLNDRSLRRLAASALQSEVFNRTLAARMERGLLDRVLPGDLCRKPETGGQFVTDDAEREQSRMMTGQIELTGPMWGPKMPRPLADAAAFEREVLERCGIDESLFARIGALAEGTRRPLVVRPQELSATMTDDGLLLQFVLQSGSFATVLVHEFVGPLPDEGAGEDAFAAEAADDDVEATSESAPFAIGQVPCA